MMDKIKNVSSNELRYDQLPEPGKRFALKEIIGTGVCAKVYRALDSQSNDRQVAIKVQRYENELIAYINEEYRVLRDFSSHPNLPDFYGVYRKKIVNDVDEIWFILEYCHGGSVVDVVRALQSINRRISEEHLAYIIREICKAVCYLHDNNVIHRDIRGSNVLLTKEGEVKLIDFGLARDIQSNMGKRTTCIGSSCWMAPEVVACTKLGESYGSRADVWAIGITAIELADGKAPFADMHPTRAMFQIVRNPPPTLYRQSIWSQNFNDFIAECLEKNPDHRAFMVELMEHPFLTELPDNDYHLSQEVKMHLMEVDGINFPQSDEVLICKGVLKTHDNKTEKMFVEDLAALERLTDETIVDVIKSRLLAGNSYSFVGDVLLSVNPNIDIPVPDRKFHNRYMFKSRSDNAPHIFSVVDSAYQDMMHNEEAQNILFAGESYSGKTTNMRLAFQHLIYMGEGNAGVANRIKLGLTAVNALTHAGTPLNSDSTRCAMQVQMTFGQTGKISGTIFWIYLLEKIRVSSTNMSQSNFHIFYYFYDAMDMEERLMDFDLHSGRSSYRYLRLANNNIKTKLTYVKDTPRANASAFKEFEQALLGLDFPLNMLESMYKILAAILMIGEIRFKQSNNSEKKAELEDQGIPDRIAGLLKVDAKKFKWALLNYCFIKNGQPEKRRHTADEARDARDILASTIYSRLVDYIVNVINQKLSLGRAIFGDIHSIMLTDMFGFECFYQNHFDQLMVNSLNEQMQYHYNQRMFVWEMIEQEEEGVPGNSLHFYDNKLAVDQLMTKPKGLFHIIDDSSKGRHTYHFLTDALKKTDSVYVKRVNDQDFSVSHYTGKLTYDCRDIPEKNRDFLPPELLETLRTSDEEIIKISFTNKLSKTGNLTMSDGEKQPVAEKTTKKGKWGAALLGEKIMHKKMNTLSKGQYSQIHKMRTVSAVFRTTCLEILKGLSVSSQSTGTHFIRCVRPNLDYMEYGFNDDMVRQQLRGMSVLDTAKARQNGFSHRIPFQEFLRRYKFLAFEFDEHVEMTKDNCRLLLIRLKMEGWVIGSSKVFLKYYNEEYLSRLYEQQVKKIIKVQSMMRAFLAKKNLVKKVLKFKQQNSIIPAVSKQASVDMDAERASVMIQSAYRGYRSRKQLGPLTNANGTIDFKTAKFIEPYAMKWKNKSLFQVLLQYRAAKFQDLVNFSQQVHIFNQKMVHGLSITSNCVLLERVDPNQRNKDHLGPMRHSVWKIPFRLDDIPFFDTTYMCDPSKVRRVYTSYESDGDSESWDAPMKRRHNLSSEITAHMRSYDRRGNHFDGLAADDDMIVNHPFHRDAGQPMRIPPRNFDYSPSRPARMGGSRNTPPPQCYSPTPYSKPRITDIKEQFDMETPSVYKKKPAPRPPLMGVQNEFEISSYKKRPAPQPNIPTSKDPFIKELEDLGNKNGTAEEDAPPFNFQGMLRKTKYNRGSMKRSKEGKLSLPGQDNANNNNDDQPFVETSTNYSHVVFHSKRTSPDSNIKITPPQRKQSLSKTDENSNMNFVSEEIVPGIMMDGDSEDL